MDSQFRCLVGLFFAVAIFGDFNEVANSANIKPTRKNLYIRYIFILSMHKIKCKKMINLYFEKYLINWYQLLVIKYKQIAFLKYWEYIAMNSISFS